MLTTAAFGVVGFALIGLSGVWVLIDMGVKFIRLLMTPDKNGACGNHPNTL